MSHNKQGKNYNDDSQQHNNLDGQEYDVHKELDSLVNHSNRNKNSRNNNIRGAHSEKPNNRQNNGMAGNQQLYSISKPQNHLEEYAKEGMALIR